MNTIGNPQINIVKNLECLLEVNSMEDIKQIS